MPNYQKTIIVGHLGKDPEVRFLDSGAVCNFSVAVNDPFDKGHTDWYNVSVWGKRGEAAGKYLNKGTAVLVEGRLKLRKYEKNGGGEGYSLDLRASDWTFASSRSEGEQGQSSQRQQQQSSFDDPLGGDDIDF